MKLVGTIAVITSALVLGGCAFSDSTLQYAQEGTKRVDAGYTAKIEMTKHLTAFLAEANKGCGVKIEIVNGQPVTTVKECIRLDDAMASVDRVQIVEPQKVKDMLESAGDFAMKATNLVVPVASIYYGFRNNEVNQNANVAIRQSDNAAQTSMWSNYTSNFENTTNTTANTTNTSTNTTSTNTTEKETTNATTTIPSINVDSNGTAIGM